MFLVCHCKVYVRHSLYALMRTVFVSPQAVLQQVGGRTVLLDNRAAPEALKTQASALLTAVEGVLSSSQLGSFSAPAWASPLPTPSDGALHADLKDDPVAEAVCTLAQGAPTLLSMLAFQG